MAKALRDFARTNPLLVIKGGLLGDKVLVRGRHQRPGRRAPRDVLLAQLAGALAAPMQQMAGLLQALPRNFAYGLAGPDRAAGGAPEAPPPKPRQPPAEPEADGCGRGRRSPDRRRHPPPSRQRPTEPTPRPTPPPSRDAPTEASESPNPTTPPIS